MNTKSLVTFIRKQLGFKGKSQHNGRGAYECSADCEPGVLYNKVSLKIAEWQKAGLTEKVNVRIEGVEIIFKESIFHPTYRGLFVPHYSTKPKYAPDYVIFFTMPSPEMKKEIVAAMLGNK